MLNFTIFITCLDSKVLCKQNISNIFICPTYYFSAKINQPDYNFLIFISSASNFHDFYESKFDVDADELLITNLGKKSMCASINKFSENEHCYTG